MVLLKFQVFKAFLRAEVRPPRATGGDVAQLGLNHPAQLGGSRLRFRLQDFVNFSLDADGHSCSQF
jgi:hypothetical protein